MNYKKSLLSLVTIMALSNTVSADQGADYLPLTNLNNDSSWVLFGVNGFSDGTPSVAAAATDFTAGYISLEDLPVNDELATEGLVLGGGNMGALQALKDATPALTALKVGVDLTGLSYQDTEPVRTMYIKVRDGNANVKFDYKASLEGRTLEIIIDNQTNKKYSVTINQDYTFSNAAIAVDATVAASSTTDLTGIVEVLDMNFSNPINAAQFDKTVDLQTTGQTASFYHFDAKTQQWRVWNKNNMAAANDFTAFSKGEAYWGQVDTKDAAGSLVNDADGSSGLILGVSEDVNASIYDDKLTNGWNMISFSDQYPYIRHASTGLLVDVNSSAVGQFKLTDDTGAHSVYVNLNSVNYDTNLTENMAKRINATLEAAKLLGTVPSTFNVKAFPADNTNAQLIFLSDKKFSLLDSNGTDDNVSVDIIQDITTLTGADPYVAGLQSAFTDLSFNNEATSAYGEYAIIAGLMTTDLNNTATAADLDNVAGGGGSILSAKVKFGDETGENTISLAPTGTGDDVATLATFNTNITAADPAGSPIFNTTRGTGRAISIDLDFDGAVDKAVIASTKAFYMRDATFTRVYSVDTAAALPATSRITVGSSTITPVQDENATGLVVKLNAIADSGAATQVYAAESASKNLIVVTTDKATFDLKDVASGTYDVLSDVTSDTDPRAQGAIAGVYSIDELSRKPIIQHSISATTWDAPNDINDTLAVNINMWGDYNVTAGLGSLDTGVTADVKAYFDTIVLRANTYIRSQNPVPHIYASHDYTEAVDDFAATKVTVSGVDLRTFTINEQDDNTTDTTPPTNGTDLNTSDTINEGDGDLTTDLRFNATYVPNYAAFGPLYTLRDVNNKNGFDVRAILKATTDMNTTNITWDSIDLTRNESDWFKNNEFNLFSIDHASGYWAYLVDRTPDTVTIGAITYEPTYIHHFENDTVSGLPVGVTNRTTRNIINGGILTVEITGLTDATSTAFASIGGIEIPLKQNGTGSTAYTADLGSYSILGFTERSGTYEISVRATNGKGEYKVTTDVQKLIVDYAKPAAPTFSIPNDISGTLTGPDVNDTTKFYVFKDFIPEVVTDRATALTTSGATITAIAGSGTFADLCPKYSFGAETTLRAVVADGDGGLGTSNLSNALEFKYLSALNNSHVLTHLGTAVVGDKSQTATAYDTTCQEKVAADQPANQTITNNGVSLKSLAVGQPARLAYAPIANINFTTNLAWTSIYALTAGGTGVIQVQNVEGYANKPFFVEYGGKMYSGTFPASQAAANNSVINTIQLLPTTSVNQLIIGN